MITDIDRWDLFCRVNVQSEMPHDELVSFIAQRLGGARRLNAITTKKLDISVDDNDVFDPELSRLGEDRWLYFKYTLEIDPAADVVPGNYVVAIGDLLKLLWASGMDAVASSDFEEQLPPNVRRLNWMKTQRSRGGNVAVNGDTHITAMEHRITPPEAPPPQRVHQPANVEEDPPLQP